MIAAALIGYRLISENRKERSLWAKKWLKKRKSHGLSIGLFHELTFDKLLGMIRIRIEKHDTNYRDSIFSAEDRLAITLRYLATG
jgi:hypothetical protein